MPALAEIFIEANVLEHAWGRVWFFVDVSMCVGA